MSFKISGRLLLILIVNCARRNRQVYYIAKAMENNIAIIINKSKVHLFYYNCSIISLRDREYNYSK